MNNSLLLKIIVISVIITSLHYTDNALFIDQYPEPEWIKTYGVFLTWGIMSAIAFIAYFLYARKQYWGSYLLLTVYSITGLSSPIHYLYGKISDFSPKMHLLIWTDFIAGSLIVIFIIWFSVVACEWNKIETNTNIK